MRGGMRRLLSVTAAALVVAAPAAVLTSSAHVVPAAPATSFVLLQMNLCNSGLARASCYTLGRSVDEAVGNIRRYRPELVTLQEICRSDLYARDGWGKLARAMADLYGSAHVAVDFAPAVNRYTDDSYRCVNGEAFGVAVMHHYAGRDAHHGRYDSQDDTDEERVWTCTTVIPDRLTGCTTHLSTEPDVAVRQCHELASILAAPWVLPEVVVAGDFNLRSGSARGCAPAGYDQSSDDDVQQVFFTRNVHRVRGGYEAARWTDHPVLYQWFRV